MADSWPVGLLQVCSKVFKSSLQVKERMEVEVFSWFKNNVPGRRV